jgi:hypothetical protein
MSPRTFQLPSKFEKRPNVPEQEDVFYTPASKDKQNQHKDRMALTQLDTNHHTEKQASTSKLPTVYHTSIPKPPLIPDVFTPAQKRAQDGNGQGERPAKYRVIDVGGKKIEVCEAPELGEARARRKAILQEQEKWRGKWMKSFPTLTLHFEVEAEQGAGKALKARAIKMGAVRFLLVLPWPWYRILLINQ